MKTMAELSPGEWGYAKEHTEERLMQLGLIPGTKVQCLQKSPLRDPVAYEIRGSVFAIRKKNADNVSISEDGEAGLWD